MKRLIPLLPLIVVFFFFSACTGTEDSATPTPFSKVSSPTPNIGAASPLVIAYEDLIANPAAYEGARIQLSGQYKKLPILICVGEVFQSPATWSLENDSLIAPISGFGKQVESLLPENITMVVNGIWRRWRGPIGCGKEATHRNIWYLDVREIVAPSPLARVTLTPIGEEVADLFVTPTAVSAPDDETPIAEATQQPTPITQATPTLFATATQPVGGSSSTSTPTPTTNSSSSDTPTPTSTPSQTPTPSGSSNQTATPTPNSANSPTPTPGGTDIGTLVFEDFTFASLRTGVIHNWQLDLFEDDVITISAIMQQDANPVLTLIDPDGTAIVLLQDNSPAEEAEVIRDLQIKKDGVYELKVQTASGKAADYVLNLFEENSIPTFKFEGLLIEEAPANDPIDDILDEDRDDIWVFFANAGEVYSFTVTPEDDDPQNGADLFLTLYSRDGIEDESNLVTLGATESIDNFTAPHTGLFVLQISDWDLMEREYIFVFVQN